MQQRGEEPAGQISFGWLRCQSSLALTSIPSIFKTYLISETSILNILALS